MEVGAASAEEVVKEEHASQLHTEELAPIFQNVLETMQSLFLEVDNFFLEILLKIYVLDLKLLILMISSPPFLWQYYFYIV